MVQKQQRRGKKLRISYAIHIAPSDLFLRISFGKYLLSGIQNEEKYWGPIKSCAWFSLPLYYLFRIFFSILDHCGNVPTHSTAHIYIHDYTYVFAIFQFWDILGKLSLLSTDNKKDHISFFVLQRMTTATLRKPRLSRDFRIFRICLLSLQTKLSDR